MKAFSLQVRGWKHYGEAKDDEPTYNGVKLMEHSWIGNSFMTAISRYIYKNPMQIAWVGDYASDYVWDYDTGNKPDPKELCKLAWQDIREEDIDKAEFDLKGKYLVNHTRGLYLDLDKYIKESTDSEGWCIHPLSLLTACGNDLGGGDFHRGGVGYECVGDWCWDEISIEDEPEYTETEYVFLERY